MKLHIAGGVGEHGRNCFFIEDEHYPMILDIGILVGDENPNPHLSLEQIAQAQWLFVTHSHKDHTGAYQWLQELGFSGKTVLTKECARQLTFPIQDPIYIDDFEHLTLHDLADGLRIMWGRTGHCLGAVWYHIYTPDFNILYSGDYVEKTTLYPTDLIRDQLADLAILDNGYGKHGADAEINWQNLSKNVQEQLLLGKNLIFPIPKFGRGLEILTLLAPLFNDLDVFADEHFLGELDHIKEEDFWVKEGAIPQITKPWTGKPTKQSVLFLSDPQLKDSQNQKLVKELGWEVILTGSIKKGTFAESLDATFLRYSVHMNTSEMEHVAANNTFKEVLPFHS